jgi:hypothetical protein
MAQKSTFNKNTPVQSVQGGGVRTAGGQVIRPTPGPTPTFNAKTPVASMQGGGVRLAGGQIVRQSVQQPQKTTNTTQSKSTGSTSGGGGGGGQSSGTGGGSQPVQDTDGGGGYSMPDFGDFGQSEYMAEVDRTFNSIIDILGRNEAYLGESRAAADRQAQADFEANRALLGNQKSQSIRTLGEQREQGITKREDALAQARRLYQQAQMGARQRFGGMSGAAGATSEILGEELMRQQGGTTQQYAQFEREIANAERKVNEDYDAGFMALNQSFQQAKAKVQQDFTSAIMQINNMRAATEQERGAARLNALQNVRNQINALNMQQMTFNQQIEAMRQQNLMNIDAYKQTSGGLTTNTAGKLGTVGSTTPNFSAIRALQPGQTMTTPEYVGQVGYVRGRSRDGQYQYSPTATGPITNYGPGGFLQG